MEMNRRFPNGKTVTGLIIVTITLLSFLGPMVSFSVQAANAAVIQPNRTFLLPGAPATILGSSGATIWTNQPYNALSAPPTNYGAGFFSWVSSLFSSVGANFAAPLITDVYASSAPAQVSGYLVVWEVNPSGAGSTNPTDNATYALGSSVSIVATAGSGYAFSGWSVSSPSITLADPTSASTTATINGDGTVTANFSPTTMQPASTQTNVFCSPGSVDVGSSTTCTVTVSSSVSVTGQTVSVGSTGSGIFDSTSCTLDGSPTACTVSYTPSALGTGADTITGNYVGDANHQDSSGSFTLTVTPGTMTTTTTTTPTSTSGTAKIWTDLPDYAPTDTPTIYGTGFLANANITVSVTRPEGTVNTWFVMSDASGGFTTTYVTSGLVFGTFTVTATDGTNTATTTFTDASHIQTVVVGPQSPSSISPGNSATYTVTIAANGNGANPATLSVTSGLPTGASASFIPNPASADGSGSPHTSQLTISTTGSTPTGTFTFTVRAVADSTITNTGTLVVLTATTTSLNAISTPLPTGQTGVPFSGSVTPSSVPNGMSVLLRYVPGGVCPSDRTTGTLAATVTTSNNNGGFSGTFTAPLTGSYQFWAYFVGGSGYASSYSSPCQSIAVNSMVGSVSASAQSPNPVTAGNSATYTVTVNRATGAVGAFSVSLSITTVLPLGVTALFLPAILPFASGDNSQTSTLTLTTSSNTPIGTGSFTVKAVNLSDSTDFKTGTGTLTVAVPSYQVTFTSSDIAGDTSGTVVTVNSVNYAQSQLPFTASYSSGSSITYSYASPVTATAGKQYRWTGTSGLGQSLQSNTFTVSGTGTVTGTYVVQWQQTFQQSGLSSDATGTVVTVNSVPVVFGGLPYSVYVDAGSSVSYLYASSVSSSTPGKQYALTTPASSPASPINNINGVNTITGTYKVQWQQSFQNSGLTADAAGVLVSLSVSTGSCSATSVNVLSGSVFCDAGTTYSFTFSSTVTSSVTGKQYSLTAQPSGSPGHGVRCELVHRNLSDSVAGDVRCQSSWRRNN